MKIPLSAKIPTKRAQQTLHFRVFRRARGEAKRVQSCGHVQKDERKRNGALFRPLFAPYISRVTRAPLNLASHMPPLAWKTQKKKGMLHLFQNLLEGCQALHVFVRETREDWASYIWKHKSYRPTFVISEDLTFSDVNPVPGQCQI